MPIHDLMQLGVSQNEFLNWPDFLAYCSRNTPESIEKFPRDKLPQVNGLAQNGFLNLTGILHFSRSPQIHFPVCVVNCISYSSNQISNSDIVNSKECKGTILEQYKTALEFLTKNLKEVEIQNVNTCQTFGLEISIRALQEALVNALLHRDYSITASIHVSVFTDRVEIVSPGAIPNRLSIDKIKLGIGFKRNQILCSIATKILPYTGFGSGIRRILAEHPETEFISDEKPGDQFTVIFTRPKT